MPAEEDRSGLDKLHDGQDKRLDALFDGVEPAPEPVKKEPSPPKPAPEPDPKGEPPAPEEKPEDDINFDAPPPGSDEKTRETAAQKRARENGQALETLKTEHQETVLERNRLKEEIELLKKAGNGQAPVRREDFLAHPEVGSLRREILTDRNAVAEVQSFSEAGSLLTQKFGSYMTDFIAKNAEQDQASAQAMDSDLRKAISEDFKTAFKQANGDGYDEAEMNAGAKEFTRDVLQLLVRNAGKTQQIEEKIGNLVSKAREGALAQNVEVYQFHENDLGTALDAIPGIPDTVIAENPHTVEATVAGLLKQPAWKERYDATRKQVLELLLGPRALTQKELDDMQAGGVDVKDFNKKRQKSFLERRKKLAVSITQSLLLRGLWEQTSRDAASHVDANAELDILSRGKPKAGDPPPAPQPKRPAGEFRSAVEDILDEAERPAKRY